MKAINIALIGMLCLRLLYPTDTRAANTASLGSSTDAPSFGTTVLPDTHAVKVRFGNKIYAVPRNYLLGASQPATPNEYASIYIQAELPRLSPLPAQVAGKSAQLDRAGLGDRLRALFEYGRHPRAPEELLRFYLQVANKSTGDFKLIGSGYKLYEFKNVGPSEIYTKETSSGTLLFTCENQKQFSSIKYPSCTVNEYLGDNAGVIYHFSKTYMDKASEIDSRLRELMRSFLLE